MDNETRYKFWDIVEPYVNYFLTIIKHEDYSIIYSKWTKCEDQLHILKDIIGDNLDLDIKEQTPLKIMINYYKYFNLKRYIIMTDLVSYDLQDKWIDLMRYRNICIKDTLLLNLYYNKTFPA